MSLCSEILLECFENLHDVFIIRLICRDVWNDRLKCAGKNELGFVIKLKSVLGIF